MNSCFIYIVFIIIIKHYSEEIDYADDIPVYKCFVLIFNESVALYLYI